MKSSVRTVAVAALALAAWGCQNQSPEERVAELRSRYEAELNSWVVRAPEAPPAAEPTSLEEEAPEAVEATEAAVEAGDAEAAADVTAEGITVEDLSTPQSRDIVLDILLQHDARENLDGLTLDVSQAGEDEVEKNHYRIWVPTAQIARGQQAQLNYVLEGVSFAPGDVFFVEVRKPVPAEERGEYREFAEAAPE